MARPETRSTLAAGVLLTAPGIPMLFQGQEFVESRSFSDTVPLDWNRCERHRGIVHLYRDLIALRLNRAGVTRGLCGQHVNVHHVNEGGRVLAYHRWERGGGRADDVIVVANFSHRGYHNYVIGLPRGGRWRCAEQATGRGTAACSVGPSAATATLCRDDMTRCRSTALTIGPYSVLVLSQDG